MISRFFEIDDAALLVREARLVQQLEGRRGVFARIWEDGRFQSSSFGIWGSCYTTIMTGLESSPSIHLSED